MMPLGLRCSKRLLRRCVIVAACAGAAITRPLGAQDAPPSAWARGHDATGAASSGLVSWLGAWSPLRPIVDIPRGMLRAPVAPGLLQAPPPMTGAFVLSGAAGALVRDLSPHLSGDTARFGDLRIRLASDAGDFRRPLDMAESRVTQASGIGFSPVGSRGVVIGRFVIDREQNDVSSFTQRITPYWSSPFIMTDSVTPPMRRTRARFEGGVGVQLAGFGLGASAGVESREHQSIDFPLRRGGRAATPAVVLGVERVLPWMGLRVGGYHRWSEPTETNVLNPLPLKTVIYAVRGFEEPEGLPVSDLSVFIRNDNRATATGGTVEFTAVDTRVVFVHERGDRAQDQYSGITAAVRPTERWRATGSQSRASVQREFGSRIRGTLVAATEWLEGNAVRSDLTGIAVDGRDERSALEADIRVRIASAWTGALVGGATRLTSTRRDFVADVASDIASTTPFAAVEVARSLRRGALAAGASIATSVPSGTVPLAADQGPNYRRIIAPALAYDAAESRAVAAWVTWRAPVRGGTVLASVRTDRATPTSVAAARLQPGGERTGWRVEVGMQR